MSRLWLTGYRSYEMGIFKDNDPKLTVIKYALKLSITQAIEEGVDWVLTGGQLGTEQWAIEVVNELKEDYDQLRLGVILPFQKFGSQWKEDKQIKLASLIASADFHDQIYHQEYQGPYQLRAYQDFMLEHSDRAFLLYDPDFPGKVDYDYQKILKWQEERPYPLTNLTMDDLQEIATDYEENQKL
ncbi:DUF1273 domain-containing protein [Eupransor demetentiae]|uniref:UPF0398 protein R54876_GBNLAHCA_00286 n=1 Tax=Eupransor demetentiae TaxID=3109584 RepID=A0ABP0ERL7_9LACO|nr:Uncharacterized SPBc2 prophage-derived protein YoqJ (YoqJ) [Lactobacillaceae bacterium LMG 33000]